MPAPQAATMQELAKTQFRSFAIKVPNQPPLPAAFLAAAKPGDRSVAPAPMPPALFLPDSAYKLHVDTQKHLTEVFGGFWTVFAVRYAARGTNGKRLRRWSAS